MKNIIKYMLIMSFFTGIISCNDFLDPIDENRLDFDFVTNNPGAAEGVLLQGYSRLVNQFTFNDAATDDAVNNQLSNGFKRMALGELNSQFNPTSQWDNYESVLWVNKFLEAIESGKTVWHPDTEMNEMFNLRLKGEALALRGLHHYYILQAHAGKNSSGILLGIPYIKEFIESDENFNLPRLSFEETVQLINDDFNEALSLLPTIYSNNQADVDPFYESYDFEKYKVVNGNLLNLRISGRIVKAFKARLALFAASPSFLNDQNYYDIAANEASEILSSIGGVGGLNPNGVEFYATTNGYTDGEVIWRGSEQSPSSSREKTMFPPSVNGNGQINPTQNFVDAFPMVNGTPIKEATDYDPQNPYANRDPRLEKFVVTNGSSFGGSIINTGVGGGIDRLDSIPQFSTTTGYYLKKLLRPDVRLNDDGSTVDQVHFDVYFRYTELFLIFAEAANESAGPQAVINGMSAYTVLKAIRERAGITGGDAYLESVKSNKEAMRELIRNERRLELSFEGHRFWDIRRWGLPLTEAANGYFFDGNNYLEIPSVEVRNYQPFAIYMPIPNNEVLRFPALEQNSGW